MQDHVSYSEDKSKWHFYNYFKQQIMNIENTQYKVKQTWGMLNEWEAF